VTTHRWHIGDTRTVLATMEPGSVSCVVTSPPYLAKRAYLPADHPDKHAEMGQEPTPAEFLDGLLGTMDLLWDVLADDGVAFINLGDTASGSGGSGGDYNEGGLREGQAKWRGSAARNGNDVTVYGNRDRWTGKGGWPRPKSVCWMPELFGASLAYGRNLLTGEPCRQWITRPSITWCKPNPSVGAIFDKFREATELVVFATKQPRYWFDIDPVRTPSDYDRPNLRAMGARKTDVPGQRPNAAQHTVNEKGAPPLNWQAISPQGYSGAHFAVMPPKLARLLITVACPPDGTVLDIFGGSGTTAQEAFGLGRSSVSIDLDARNVALAQDRLGLWPLDVIDHRKDAEVAS
jgi:hypothetical protein